jgi:hypothetical protein
MATYAIVHSTVSGMLRRVIADDEGRVSLGEIDGKPVVICGDGIHPLAPGESATIAQGDAASPQQWRKHIKTRAGSDPPELRCALLTGNVVSEVVMADIAVDKSPDTRTMVDCYSPLVTTGCTYDPATELFSTPPGELPPHTPGNDTDQAVTVPSAVIARP